MNFRKIAAGHRETEMSPRKTVDHHTIVDHRKTVLLTSGLYLYFYDEKYLQLRLISFSSFLLGLNFRYRLVGC